jgi:hypothetical protein
MCRFHELNSQQGVNPTMGHDRGLHRGVPHGVKRGGELRPSPPSPRRNGTEALSSPLATTPWPNDILDIVVAQ